MLESQHVFEKREQPDILLIGHVTCDLLSADPHSDYRLGGTVSFASVTAVRLDRRATVITRAASTTDLSDLPDEIELHVLPTPTTTTFANLYTASGRTQYCYAQALPITAADIGREFRKPSAVLLGPLVNEITPDVASIFDDTTLVAAVPQGWMRRWDETGRVFSKSWENADLFLPHIDALILSLEDINFDLTRLQPFFVHVPLIVVTEYHDGSTIYQRLNNGNIAETKIPPRPAQEIDPTGAGDVFATAFMVRYQETGDPVEAARFANVTASFSVEKPGVTGIPPRHQVLQYMDQFPFAVDDTQ